MFFHVFALDIEINSLRLCLDNSTMFVHTPMSAIWGLRPHAGLSHLVKLLAPGVFCADVWEIISQ